MRPAPGHCYTCESPDGKQYHIAGGQLCEKCVKEAVEAWLSMDAGRALGRVLAFKALVKAAGLAP